MKKIIILALLMSATINSFAQFMLKGKIANISKADTITLNIPFVYGYYKENNWQVAVDRMGNFSLNLPLKFQKFGTLAFNGHSVTVLLTPGKNLTVALDSGGVYNKFKGTAAVENRILYETKLSQMPYFTKGNRQTSAYAKLTNAEVQEKIIKPWLATRDERIKMVRSAKLSVADKNLLCSEIKYHAYAQLDFYARGIMNADRKQVSDLLLDIFKGTQPEPDVWPAGPFYYEYANSYLGYLDNKTFAVIEPNDEGSKASFFKTYKISLDSATRLAKLNGKAYIKWYLLNLYFSPKVSEQDLAQSIWTQYHDKDISHVTPLLNAFRINFPNSIYLPFLQNRLEQLTSLYTKNQNNAEIKVFAGYEKVTSIYEIINTLKGKVVYMDIWGTWCPACRDDLAYVPQLKQHFKDKDVVFLYLDMDDDVKDADWKTFIRVNGLTGIHLRKNGLDIQKFWSELIPDKRKQNLYPTCFIFDKNGKLVQSDAKRPPDEAELYAQLEKYL